MVGALGIQPGANARGQYAPAGGVIANPVASADRFLCKLVYISAHYPCLLVG